MADERNEVTRVNWGEVFAFSRVFKSGAMARNISMLGLGLTAILLICATGLVFDNVAGLTGQTAGVNEIEKHATMPAAAFAKDKDATIEGRAQQAIDLRNEWARNAHNVQGVARLMLKGQFLGEAFRQEAIEAANEDNEDEDWKLPKADDLKAAAEKDWAAVVKQAAADKDKAFARFRKVLDKAHKRAVEKVNTDLTDKDKDKKAEALGELEEDRITAVKALTGAKKAFRDQVKAITGTKIFDTLVAYEGEHLKAAVSALLTGNISTGMSEYLDTAKGDVGPGAAVAAVKTRGDEPGFIVEMLMVVAGARWLFAEHWLYGALLVLISLAIWALFGGAMHRVAALQAGREEKISPFEALRFARSRFLSFFCAPLMPLAFVVVLGVLLMAGGLLTNIPHAGPLLVGLLFIFALLLGLLIAFLLIGLLGGAGLMYPTIAVEGSDCFDAMSRSFTYVFSRPWRAGLYAVAALVHGAICYVFIRFFAFVALAATHCFVKAAVWTGGEDLPGVADPDKLDVLWTAPTFQDLHTWNWEAMTPAQGLGALLIMAWVYLIVGLVAAFALSYFTSGMTMIYYLLRREVDATDIDEVYVGEEEDELAPAVEPAVEPPAESEAPVDAAPVAESEAPAEAAPPAETPAEAPAPSEPRDDQGEQDEQDEQGGESEQAKDD
ncbi:MAG: hypothetical protein ISS78_05770 [Phycisphaerae bacterium]|nr:hypothetical protein [Phycisphaerae bacterium]